MSLVAYTVDSDSDNESVTYEEQVSFLARFIVIVKRLYHHMLG